MALAPASSRSPDSLLAPFGMLGQTWELQVSTTGTAMFDRQVTYNGIGLAAGTVITNLIVALAGGTYDCTAAKLGVYDKVGTRLGLTADLTTAWNAGGKLVHPLIAPVTIPTTDVYYLAEWCDFTALAPSHYRGLISNTAFEPIGAFPALSKLESFVNDLPATATFAASTISFWVGYS